MLDLPPIQATGATPHARKTSRTLRIAGIALAVVAIACIFLWFRWSGTPFGISPENPLGTRDAVVDRLTALQLQRLDVASTAVRFEGAHDGGHADALVLTFDAAGRVQRVEAELSPDAGSGHMWRQSSLRTFLIEYWTALSGQAPSLDVDPQRVGNVITFSRTHASGSWKVVPTGLSQVVFSTSVADADAALASVPSSDPSSKTESESEVESARNDPLKPLTEIAAILDRGMAGILQGRDPADAFPAEWKAKAEDLKQLRDDLHDAHVATAANGWFEVQLIFCESDRPVHCLSVDIVVNEHEAALSRITEHEVTDLSFGHSLSGFKGSARPFAIAFEAMRQALQGEGWTRIPFARREMLKDILPTANETALDDLMRTSRESQAALGAGATRIASLRPDRVRVLFGHSVANQRFVARDADGKFAGFIGGKFQLNPFRYEVIGLRRTK